MEKELPVRKRIRLQGYDYSQSGYYHITMCIKNGHEILWENDDIVGAHSMRPPNPNPRLLSSIGKTVKTAIENIPKIYANTNIDKYVIMPNHIHLILCINADENGRTLCAPTKATVSRIIKQCKEYVTKQIGYSIWHPRFYDEIIRNEEAYRNIWQYIDNNPAKWAEDRYFVKRKDIIQ